MGMTAGFFECLAEIEVVNALDLGPTGPISAVIAFNVVMVSILTWLITGVGLTWL